MTRVRKKPGLEVTEEAAPTGVGALPATSIGVNPDAGPSELASSALDEARAFTRRACDALSSRIDELEDRTAGVEDRITEYDRGGVKYPKDTKEHVVKKGETMSTIAKDLLANAGLFGKIAMWNYDRYPGLRADSNKVEEGWALRIPPE